MLTAISSINKLFCSQIYNFVTKVVWLCIVWIDGIYHKVDNFIWEKIERSRLKDLMSVPDNVLIALYYDSYVNLMK